MSIPLTPGLPAWNPGYAASWKLHQETGLFPYLIDCFLICRERGYPLPEELLQAMERHFAQAAEADSLGAVRLALGVGNRHTKNLTDEEGGGGPGQWVRAKTAAGHDNITELVEAFMAFGFDPDACFKHVAKATGKKAGYVRKLYYESR